MSLWYKLDKAAVTINTDGEKMMDKMHLLWL